MAAAAGEVPWGSRRVPVGAWVPAFVFAEDPELVEAVDQIVESIFRAHEARAAQPSSGGRGHSIGAERSAHAAWSILEALAEFLDGLAVERADAALAAMAKEHAGELRRMIEGFEDWMERRGSGRRGEPPQNRTMGGSDESRARSPES